MRITRIKLLKASRGTVFANTLKLLLVFAIFYGGFKGISLTFRNLAGENAFFLKYSIAESMPFLKTNLQEEKSTGIPQRLFLSEISLLKAMEEKISLLRNYDTQGFAPPITEMPKEENPEIEKTEELPQIPEGAFPIREVTISPKSADGYLYYDGIYVQDQSGKSPNIEEVLKKAEKLAYNSQEVQVLILHTHGSEAFAEEDKNYYQDSDSSRTQDKEKNIISVGKVLADELLKYGIKAIHNDTIHDYPSYNGSYNNALTTIEETLKKYPSIKVVIDVHRDSMVTNDGVKLKPIIMVEGQKAAQVMIVTGTDAGGLKHDSWQKNLSFSLKLQQEMNKKYPDFARPVNLRKSRFNQHMTEKSIILEVGTDGNTLSEAKKSAEMFASVLAENLKNGN